MRAINSISLSGKSSCNSLNNLSGNNKSSEDYEPPEVKILKIQILNKIIIPMVNEDWDYLLENSFLTNVFLDKLNLYYSKYKLEDLCLYKEIIRGFDIIINEHSVLVDLQKKYYKDNQDSKATIAFRTVMIKLRPEYELYDLIYGKPLRSKKEVYNDIIIKELGILLKMNNIDFNKIKTLITNIFPKIK
jgi:hypothetical protein